MAKMPVVPLPAGFQVQPVDASEVAVRLVKLALGTPAGLVPDMAGPKVYSAAELMRGYLQANHQHRMIIPTLVTRRGSTRIPNRCQLGP